MAVTVDRIDVSSSAGAYAAQAARWLLVPVVGWALVTAAARLLRQRARHPSVPPMSDEWLRTHEAESGRAPRY